MGPSMFVDDPVLWIARNLVLLGVVAVVVLVYIVLSRVLWRERIIRSFQGEFAQEKRAAFRSEVRRTGVLRAPRVPADPFDLRTPVVIQPLGDGRPGEGFLAPGPAKPPSELGELDARMDALVALGQGMSMLVWCTGRLGARWEEGVLLPAADRARIAREHAPVGASLLGPIDPVHCRLGDGWRTTMVLQSGRAVTDTFFDQDGWAFVVGIVSSSHHARAVELLDTILATWTWLPDRGPAAMDGLAL